MPELGWRPHQRLNILLIGMLLAGMLLSAGCSRAESSPPAGPSVAPEALNGTGEAREEEPGLGELDGRDEGLTIVVNPVITLEAVVVEEPSALEPDGAENQMPPATEAEPTGRSDQAAGEEDRTTELLIVANGYLAADRGRRAHPARDTPCGTDGQVELWFDYSDGSSGTSLFALQGEYALVSTDPQGRELVVDIELTRTNDEITCQTQLL